jgi:hypothetical protein
MASALFKSELASFLVDVALASFFVAADARDQVTDWSGHE